MAALKSWVCQERNAKTCFRQTPRFGTVYYLRESALGDAHMRGEMFEFYDITDLSPKTLSIQSDKRESSVRLGAMRRPYISEW